MWKAVIGAAVLSVLSGEVVHAQGFMPPAGYSDSRKGPQPGVAVPTDPTAPVLTRLPDASLQPLFHLNPTYSRASFARVKVVGAFTVAESQGAHFVDAWGVGYLPVFMSFSDGRCFAFAADYEGGTLSNGRMHRAGCEPSKPVGQVPQSPPDPTLRLVGYNWGYGAYMDDRSGKTIVGSPETPNFEPLFTADMDTMAIMAMNGPDWPGGNVTLVGRIKGQLTVVTLEVGF